MRKIGAVFSIGIFLLSISASQVYADEVGINELTDSVAQQLDSTVKQHIYPLCTGASIGVVYNGNVVYTKSYGTHTLNGSYPWTDVSNTLVTMLVMKLVEKGELKLDAPIVSYAPQFYVKYPRAFKNPPLTLRHLLTHRSGLVDRQTDNNNDDRDPGTFITPAGGLRRFAQANFTTIVNILEMVEGKPFARLLEQYLGDSLQAKSLVPDKMADGKPAYYFVSSTINDFAKFAASIAGHKLLSDKTEKELKRGDNIFSSGQVQGLGFWIEVDQGDFVLHHPGDGDSKSKSVKALSYLYVKPDKKQAAVVFCSAKSGSSAKQIAKNALKEVANAAKPCIAADCAMHGKATGNPKKISPSPNISPMEISISPSKGSCINNPNQLVCFEIWRREYLREATTTLSDMDQNGSIGLPDFEVWRRSYVNNSP